MTAATDDTDVPTVHPDFRHRATGFTTIVERVDRWDAETPCAGWTGADILRHVVDSQREFLERHGLSIAAVSLDDPATGWRAHVAQVQQVLTDDVLAREYDGHFGRTTVRDTMADFYGWDLVIHGWDLARATGQDWSMSDAEAEQMMRTADGWGEALYADGICGPAVAVPDDAPLADRLLARLGRDPGWRPGTATPAG